MAKKRKKVENNETAVPAANEDATAEAAGVNSDDLLALLELSAEGVLIVDPESREVFLANQAAERLLKKKMAKIFAEPFADELQDGPMRGADLHMKVHSVTWQGQDARYLVISPLTSHQSAFHVEWRIEAAEERAREAEARVQELEAQVQQPKVSAEGPSPEVLEDLHRQLERSQELTRALTTRVGELEQSLQELTFLKEASDAGQASQEAELEAARELLSLAGEQESANVELRRDVEKLRLAEQEALTRATLAHDQNVELQGQLQHLEERLSQLESEHAEAERRSVAAESRAREAETLMEEAELQAQETERHLEDLTDSVRKVEETLEETSASLRQEQERKTQLEAEVEALKEQLESKEYELEAARSLVESATGEHEMSLKHLEEMEQLREQLRLLQEESGQAHQLFEEASNRTQSLEEELHKSQGALKEEQARFQDEIEAWKTRLAEVEAQYTEMQELQVHDLAESHKAELEALQNELAQARSQAEAGTAQAAELEELKVQLEAAQAHAAELEPLKAQLEGLRGQLDSTEAQAADEVELLNAQLDEVNVQLEDVQTQYREAQAQLEEARSRVSEVDLLRTQLDEAFLKAAQAEELSLEMESMTAQLADLRKKAEAAEFVGPELDYLRAQVEGFRAKTDESEAVAAELEQLRQELEQVRQATREAEQRAAELEELVEVAEEKAENSQDEFHAEQALSQSRAQELEEARADLRAALEELAQLRSQAVSGAEAQDSQLREQIATLQTDLQQRQRELDQQSQEHLLCKSRLQDTEAALEQVAADLEESRAEQQRQQQQEVSQHEMAAEATEQLHQQLMETQSQLETLRKLSALAETEHLALKDELEALRLQHGSGQPTAPAAGLESEGEAWLQVELEHAQDALIKVQTDWAAAEQRANELQARLKEVEAQGAPSQWQSELAQAEQRARDAEARVAQLQSAQPAEGAAPQVDPETEALAFQDTLTGQPNYNLVRRYLEFAIQQVERYERSCALIHLDLDHFQVVNDALGWAAGDALLVQVCERLQTCVRSSDVLGRKGEDEFYIILSEVSGEPNHPDSAAVVVQRIAQVFKTPFEAGGQKIDLTACLGVSQFPADATKVDHMFEHAAAAMRRCKKVGRNATRFYTSEMQERFEARTQLRVELRKAIDQNQFQLLYQPIVSLKTGTMVGVESLLRWNHPSSVLLPEHFLEVAEESGLLVVLGRWIILQACKQSHEWAQAGLDIFVSINLSQREFLQSDLVKTLERSLEVTQAPARNLVLEIPETLQMVLPGRVQRVLGELRQIGVKVALDRFGSGFSRLENLQNESADYLKIDPRFVTQIPHEAAAGRVATAATLMGKSLNMAPIAVGVETEAQMQFCREVDCDLVQGNLIYRPVDPKQIQELYRAGRLRF